MVVLISFSGVCITKSRVAKAQEVVITPMLKKVLIITKLNDYDKMIDELLARL